MTLLIGSKKTNDPKVIHFMYDHDLLEGQVITHWHAKFNGELNDNFLANISRLIDHLAESSDEESDDESD